MNAVKTTLVGEDDRLRKPLTLRLAIGHASDVGLRRAENQDAVGYRLATDPSASERAGSLFVVCDGIGGSLGGKKASRVAVREFIRAYFDASAGAGGVEKESPAVALRAALAEANHKVYLAAGRAGALGRMGTTVVAAAVVGSDAWLLNVGDSRAYLFHAGRLRQLSEDHVPSGRKPGDRSIDRAVGTNAHVTPFLCGPLTLAAGDRLLLCTDGLTTAVTEGTIAALLQAFSAPEAARQLIERAKTGGAADNVSALVVGAEALEPERSERRMGHAGENEAAPGRVAAAAARLGDPAWQRRWLPWIYLVALILVLLVGVVVGQRLAG